MTTIIVDMRPVSFYAWAHDGAMRLGWQNGGAHDGRFCRFSLWFIAFCAWHKATLRTFGFVARGAKQKFSQRSLRFHTDLARHKEGLCARSNVSFLRF